MTTAEPAAGDARRGGLLGRLFGAWARRRTPARPPSAHDFSFQALDGGPMKLADYRGRALLVVNTASQCGFTAQYAALQHLHQTYEPRGLTVIGVPSNDFGGQEPGTEEQIAAFCRAHFGVNFPLTAKTRVIGADAHPFYRWAADELGSAARPRWNFHKYLVAPDGALADWFSTVAAPTSHRVLGSIERALPG